MTQEDGVSPGPGIHDEVTKSLVPEHVDEGVLIPLKTTLELLDDHCEAQALITRCPVKNASQVIRLAFQNFPVLFHAESHSILFQNSCGELVLYPPARATSDEERRY